MSTRSTYRPAVKPLELVCLDLQNGTVRRYVRTQYIAGMRARPFLSHDLVIPQWDRRAMTIPLEYIERLRKEGEHE